MANGIPLRPGLQPFLRPRASVVGVRGVSGQPYFSGTPGTYPLDPRQQQRGLFDVMSQQGYAAPPRPAEDFRFRGFTAPPRPQVPAGYTGFAPPPRPQPAVPAPRQPNLLERIGAIDPTSAAGQALGAAAATGLQLSGYRPTPITTAEGLGAMMAAGQEAFREQKADERAEQLELLNLAKPSDFERKLRLAGIDPTTPEGQQQVKDILQKPQTVFMGGEKQKELAYKSAMESRKKMIEEVGSKRELASRLETAIRILESDETKTGPIQAAMLPLRQLARDAGILGEKESKNLSDQEIIDSVASFAAPNMRVAGSGSSSDKDMDLFGRATVTMNRTPQSNLMIARMQLQVMNYNKKRLNLLDKYIEEFGSDLNFGEYADEKLGNVYQRVSNDEELTAMIENGKIEEGDVFYNNFTGEFVTLTKDMM
jgi:hypothetical protein